MPVPESTVPLWQQPVTYSAVGGTKADDLLSYPPAGYRPIVRRTRIGHGDNRFHYATTQVMSWGVQRLSGMDVEVMDAPAAVTDATYSPIAFGSDGTPVQAASLTDAGEDTFAADGTSFLVPGDTAILTIPFARMHITAPVRVVYVINEPNRRGFAYGTLAGHPESGEESFVIERSDEGSVWITITAFSRPSSLLWRLAGLPLRIAQRRYIDRYLRVLAGPVD